MATDLSGVQIHACRDSATLAESIGARAFTLRKHIFFNRGEFSPGSSSGRRLLAHELAHVAQQADSPSRPIVRRAVKFHDQVGAARTRIVDETNRASDSDTLIQEFVAGLEQFFGIKTEVRMDPDTEAAVVTMTGEVPDFVATQFSNSAFLKALSSGPARKVMVRKTRQVNEFKRDSVHQDFTPVDEAAIKERYHFVRNELIARLRDRDLDVKRSTTRQGVTEPIRYQEPDWTSGEEERVEVTPERYRDIIVYKKSGWSGFWIMAHEILHGAGRADDDPGVANAGGSTHLNTQKEVPLRYAYGDQRPIKAVKKARAWTTVGEPEYDLNMVRMISDMPHRSGYSDEVDKTMVVRFSYHSAPPEVGGPEDVRYSSEPRRESYYEFIGAEMTGGQARVDREAASALAEAVKTREARLWSHILSQGHPGEWNGDAVTFRFFGSEGRLSVAVTKRSGQAKLFNLKLEVQTAGGSAKEAPQVTGINFRFKSEDQEKVVSLSTSSAEEYQKKMTALKSGSEQLKVWFPSDMLLIRLYDSLSR